MICPSISPVYGGLLLLLLSLVSSVPVYIQTGSEISACNMKCSMYNEVLELYRQCGRVEESLLEFDCNNKHTKNHKSRLDLDPGSGCWKLTQAGKGDSCVYTTEFQRTGRQFSSADIRVFDPVLISNIISNCSRLGEEMVVSIQFSGEESAVTWEVDGEPLPERYRLIDDNRILIIPSVQRDDAERRFRVRITNPVSEEIREYRLINDTKFIRMLEAEDPGSVNGRVWYPLILAVLPVGLVMIYIVYQIYGRKREVKNNSVSADVLLAEVRSVPPIQNGSISINGVYEDVPLAKNGSVPPINNGSISTNAVYEDVPLAEGGSVPPIQNGSILTTGVPQVVPLAENRSVPPIQNGSIPTNKIGSPPATQNTF